MITALTIICSILILAVTFLLNENHKRTLAVQNQWEIIKREAKRMDDLDAILMRLQQDLSTTSNRLETTTELSLLNNKFIETVKKTAEEQVASAKSRIAAIQSRGVR